MSKINNNSWSAELEELHEEPTHDGWIDVYERRSVIDAVSGILRDGGKTVIEFGASVGYMIGELAYAYPGNRFIATDLMSEGLMQSHKRNPDIEHIVCDFTNAPFDDNSVDLVYSLNVLEHIADDCKAISECFRVLRPGGHCLLVVPRGDKLYDYFDEMLYHKRRYAAGELRAKCETAGFDIDDDFHFAWIIYPAFWLKKKWNRQIGKHLSQQEKMSRVKSDVNHAMALPLAESLIKLERKLAKVCKPGFGVREFILVHKPGIPGTTLTENI